MELEELKRPYFNLNQKLKYKFMLSKSISALFLLGFLTACFSDSSTKNPSADESKTSAIPIIEGIWVRESDCGEYLTITHNGSDSFMIAVDNELLYDEIGNQFSGFFDSAKQQFNVNTDTGVAQLKFDKATQQLVSSAGVHYLYWSSNNPDVDMDDTLNIGTWSYNHPNGDGSDLFIFDIKLKKNGLGLVMIGEGQDLYMKQSIKGDSLLLSRNAGFISKDITKLYGFFSSSKDSLTIKWPIQLFNEGAAKDSYDFDTRLLVLQKDTL